MRLNKFNNPKRRGGDTQNKMETKYETGATTHAVNDLILFADNTRELAQLRDDLYSMKTLEATNFIPLLNASVKRYKSEFPTSHSHITQMSENEKLEFINLYAQDFENWKQDHQ